MASAETRKIRRQTDASLQLMKQQQAYSLEQMAYQQQLNREQYDYEYDKESPASMVQRFKEAGLNSGLMYGQGAGSGMQGSVGTVSSSGTPSGGMPSGYGVPAGASIASAAGQVMTQIAGLEKLRADTQVSRSEAGYYNALTDQVYGNTKPQQVDMQLKSYNMKLYDSYVSLNRQLEGESSARERVQGLTADLLGFEKEAQEKVYTIKSTDPNGNPIAFQLAGKFISVYGEALEVGRDLTNLHLDGKVLSNYQREVDASIAETLANAFNLRQVGSINEAKKYMEVFRTNVLLYLQENSGTVGESVKKELEAGIERLDRYMNKEFDGSTTEWLMGCMQAISGGAITAGAVMAAGRGNQRSIAINNSMPLRK